MSEEKKLDREHVVKLDPPYVFEGKEYMEVDLSGLEHLTVKDAIDAQLQLFGAEEIATTALTETTTAYARTLAVKASGKPVEFFKLMSRRLSRKVLNHVRSSALRKEKDVENHVMPLEKPYTFEDKSTGTLREYTEIDLSGIADLTCMHESAAENRIVTEGFAVTNTATNYLYACVIASMGTGLPEEFFTGLPICETVKLKNAVNDSSFFE